MIPGFSLQIHQLRQVFQPRQAPFQPVLNLRSQQAQLSQPELHPRQAPLRHFLMLTKQLREQNERVKVSLILPSQHR